jgi:hypothetical protein
MSTASGCGPSGADTCNTFNFAPGAPATSATCATALGNIYFPAANFVTRAGVVAATLVDLAAISPVTAIAKSTFIVGAAGNISSSATRTDNWSINQDRLLQNVNFGI